MFLIINLTNLKKLYIASDHAGFTLKEFVKKKLSKKIKFDDQGPHSDEISVNYPDFAHKLCKKVSKNSSNMGILICGSGFGVSIAANRHKHIRAIVGRSVKDVRMSRKHNDTNVLCIGADFTGTWQAKRLIRAFFNTEFEGGRHSKRIQKIS